MAGSTLAREFESAKVDFDELHENYKPMLHLVQELIGVIPNCDPYLEIWPTGFRTYNLLVPNLLNLPASLIGQGAPKDLVGLGMYVSSRAAGCMYCSAHTCSFALRRGASPEVVTGNYNETEAIVASVAESLGRVPGDLTHAQVQELERQLGREDAEWVVLGIALMGFLNKFMDAMGIELEPEAISDVRELIEPTGWTTGKHQWYDDLEIPENGEIPTDSVKTYLRVFRQAPGAIRLEGSWTKGVSGRVGSALMMLEDELGYSFPIVASIQQKKPVKAVSTVLRDNLNAELTTVGLDVKCLVALVFARVVGNETLVAESLQLIESLTPELDSRLCIEVGRFADAGEDAVLPRGVSSVGAAALILAKAGAPSPSTINEITIATVADRLNAAQTVEIVVWLSVLQMLHRLYAFYDARVGLT